MLYWRWNLEKRCGISISNYSVLLASSTPPASSSWSSLSPFLFKVREKITWFSDKRILPNFIHYIFLMCVYYNGLNPEMYIRDRNLWIYAFHTYIHPYLWLLLWSQCAECPRLHLLQPHIVPGQSMVDCRSYRRSLSWCIWSLKK